MFPLRFWSGSLSLWLVWDLEDSPWPVVLFAAGAFAAIFLGLRFFEQAGRLSRARHLLHPAFYPSWIMVFLLVSYLAVSGG